MTTSSSGLRSKEALGAIKFGGPFPPNVPKFEDHSKIGGPSESGGALGACLVRLMGSPPLTTSASHKRRALSLGDKLEIIRQVETNPLITHSEMAKKFGIPLSTLSSILSRREFLLSQSRNVSSKCKKVKTGKYKEIEEALLEWVKQVRTLNMPINGKVIRERAEEVALRLNIAFTPTNGWIDRFKNRTGLVYKESRKAYKARQIEEVDTWKKTILPTILSAYEAQDIFNAVEFGLYYKVLPHEIGKYKLENCLDGKYSKERLTVLVSCNIDGTRKLPLLVIGRYSEPHCFRHVKTLPCHYKSNSQAWINSKIFEDFLFTFNAEMKAENRKILLFVSHSAVHLTSLSQYSNIHMEVFPANISIPHPIDVGIIKAIKQSFRKYITCNLTQRLQLGFKVDYQMSVLDAMYFLVSSWDSVKSSLIINSFKEAGFSKDLLEPEDLVEDEALMSEDLWFTLQNRLMFSCTFDEYVSIDNELASSAMVSMEEICDQQSAKQLCKRENNEDAVMPIPTSEEAVESLTILRNYIESSENVPLSVTKGLWILDKFVTHVTQGDATEVKVDIKNHCESYEDIIEELPVKCEYNECSIKEDDYQDISQDDILQNSV